MTDNAPDLELADRIIKLMNEALKLDPVAVTSLIFNRVPCNGALANHPTIQVDPVRMQVGFLGFLNGLCGAWGPEGVDGKGYLATLGPITIGEVLRQNPEDPVLIGAFVRTDVIRKK